ncbi:MAG: DNA-processing protein DprA [Chloroflexota bacterium]
MSDSRLYWIGLNLVKGIGAVRLRALLDVFGDVQTAWGASAEALRASGLSQKIVQNLVQLRADISLDQIWEQIQSDDIQVLTWDDDHYPERLREFTNAPPVLYIRGTLVAADAWAVAIVGTRRATSYGRQVTDETARTLAQSGVTIVSGLARGIDAVAHQSALDSGGRTIAVLGSGVDRIYPPEHRDLAQRIIANGAIISDYPLGTPPEAFNFPPRNRIISGLSMATVVVEAGLRSGALITANFAAEQGRDVFAVPGHVTAPQSKGPNRLIRDGAHPLLDPKEILEVLEMTMITEHRTARVAIPGNALEAQLFEILDLEPVHVDEIRARSNMPIEQVTSTLAIMELKGMVRQVGGMRYLAVRELDADYVGDH